MSSRGHVFVIVRYDEFQDSSVAIENRVTVTSVVADEKTARSEVERLNALNGPKGCRYFWQSTKLLASPN
jgi:hypothetical protein